MTKFLSLLSCASIIVLAPFVRMNAQSLRSERTDTEVRTRCASDAKGAASADKRTRVRGVFSLSSCDVTGPDGLVGAWRSDPQDEATFYALIASSVEIVDTKLVAPLQRIALDPSKFLALRLAALAVLGTYIDSSTAPSVYKDESSSTGFLVGLSRHRPLGYVRRVQNLTASDVQAIRSTAVSLLKDPNVNVRVMAKQVTQLK